MTNDLYKSMTEAEKEGYDLALDYGLYDDIEKLIQEKEAETSERTSGGHKGSI